MHNWRLLLLGFLAVIRTSVSFSERSFVDGRQECCERRPLSSRLTSHGTLHKIDPEIQPNARLNQEEQLSEARYNFLVGDRTSKNENENRVAREARTRSTTDNRGRVVTRNRSGDLRLASPPSNRIENTVHRRASVRNVSGRKTESRMDVLTHRQRDESLTQRRTTASRQLREESRDEGKVRERSQRTRDSAQPSLYTELNRERMSRTRNVERRNPQQHTFEENNSIRSRILAARFVYQVNNFDEPHIRYDVRNTGVRQIANERSETDGDQDSRVFRTARDTGNQHYRDSRSHERNVDKNRKTERQSEASRQFSFVTRSARNQGKFANARNSRVNSDRDATRMLNTRAGGALRFLNQISSQEERNIRVADGRIASRDRNLHEGLDSRASSKQIERYSMQTRRESNERGTFEPINRDIRGVSLNRRISEQILNRDVRNKKSRSLESTSRINRRPDQRDEQRLLRDSRSQDESRARIVVVRELRSNEWNPVEHQRSVSRIQRISSNSQRLTRNTDNGMQRDNIRGESRREITKDREMARTSAHHGSKQRATNSYSRKELVRDVAYNAISGYKVFTEKEENSNQFTLKNWQAYLFYMVQGIYLCNVITKLYVQKKSKIPSKSSWWRPTASLIKVD